MLEVHTSSPRLNGSAPRVILSNYHIDNKSQILNKMEDHWAETESHLFWFPTIRIQIKNQSCVEEPASCFCIKEVDAAGLQARETIDNNMKSIDHMILKKC